MSFCSCDTCHQELPGQAAGELFVAQRMLALALEWPQNVTCCTTFIDAGPTLQASAEAVALAMLEAHNYEEADYTTPVTPFLLCKNLDVATLLQPGAPPMQRRFKNCLPRVEVRKVRTVMQLSCTSSLKLTHCTGE